jgi:hypothetical protein
MDFPLFNHPAIGVPPFQETSKWYSNFEWDMNGGYFLQTSTSHMARQKKQF